MISRITFFDFIVGVTLGSLAVRISLGNESSLPLSILSAVVIVAMALLTGQLNIKSYWFRKIQEERPIILIQKGKLLDQNLSKVKIGSPEQVFYASVDPSGKLYTVPFHKSGS